MRSEQELYREKNWKELLVFKKKKNQQHKEKRKRSRERSWDSCSSVPVSTRCKGHANQGGWHPYSEEESGLGFMPSCSNRKYLDDYRSIGSFGVPRYCRNSREKENRGSFSHKGWRGHSRERAPLLSESGRPHVVKDRRLVDDMILDHSHPPHSDNVNSCDKQDLKEQDDKNDGANSLGMGQRFERGNSPISVDWKTRKWSRSGSFSSRGSGSIHSNRPKRVGVDFSEIKNEVQPRIVTPPGDASACGTSAAAAEDTSSQKKPRLRWGEGLAKYEKKKVDGPDDNAAKNGMVTYGISMEPAQSHDASQAVKSPGVAGFSDSASPATPSVICSSSPGLEDKQIVHEDSVDKDFRVLSGSPNILSLDKSQRLPFDLQNLDLISVSNLSSSISELLQSENPSLVDCGGMKSMAMNKLLVWKCDILKALEMTESEIDLLENKLKEFVFEPRSSCPCPAASSSLPREFHAKPCEGPGAASNLIPRPVPLQLDSGEMILERPMNALEERTDVRDEDIDSPGTATKKLIESLPLEKAVLPSGRVRHGEWSWNLDANRSTNLEVKCSVYDLKERKTGFVSVCGNGSQLIANNTCASLSTICSFHSDGQSISSDLILSSNKDSANSAAEVFNKLLPTKELCIDIPRAVSICSLQNDSLIKEKIAKRKRFLRFQERVLTLKFNAFQHLWKEDTHLLSIRKYRAKSQKKVDLSLRTVHTGNQKHHSAIRKRFQSPVGNMSLVPTTEIINYTSRLLSDSSVKLYRNTLKMPPLIFDKKEKTISRFISSNGLVEDPYAVEKERSIINPWTLDEQEIFIDKLATIGKDFRKIASFLDHKTTADCIEFYYKNHKSDCFEKAKKKPEFAKQGKSYSTSTYLVMSGKRWNHQLNAVSLDMLGSVSAIAANVGDGMEIQQKGILERSSSLESFGNERENAAADVLACIRGSLSAEALSSCITSSVDPRECHLDGKCQKLGSSLGPLTPEIAQKIEDETCSDESFAEIDSSNWTDEEKTSFMHAVASYGNDFAMISQCVRTRSSDHCRVFFSKARKCLGLDMVRPRPANQGTSVNGKANGGGSDAEDACIMETGSVICIDKSGSKIDEDLPFSDMKVEHGVSDPSGTMNSLPELNQSEENNGTGKFNCEDIEIMSEDRPELDLECDSNTESGGSCESLAVQGPKSAVKASNSEAGLDEAIGGGISERAISVLKEHSMPTKSGAELETKAVAEVYAEHSTARQEVVLPNGSLNDKQIENSCVSGSNCSIRDLNSVLQSAGDSLDLAADTHSSSVFGVISGYQHKTVLEFDCKQKPPVISLQQDNCFASENFATQDSAAIQNEIIHSTDASSTIDLNNASDQQCQKTGSTDDYLQHLPGGSLMDHVESSQILKGYPLSVSTKKEMDGDINCKKPPSLQSISKLDRSIHSYNCFEQDCYLQKCNSSTHHGSVADLPFVSQEQTRDLSRPPPPTSSDVEKPCRNGDIKLFGQILTPSSSQQKPDSSTRDNENKIAQFPQSCDESFNLKFTGNHRPDGNSALANYTGLENLPMRSYGLWDGNRTPTQFPSLPDSATLLAKYPAAFGKYHTSSSKRGEQTLHTITSSESTLNGSSLFPRVQPFIFTVDMKQQQDILLSEMQRRKFEAVSSFQRQARGMVATNVMGRGGILRGDSWTGVSDPVAAIKMHYARAEQFNAQAGSIRDEDSWRVKGDIGR